MQNENSVFIFYNGGTDMIVKYILWSIPAVVLLYTVLVIVCAVFVNPNRIYDKPSRLYQWILYSASWIALKITRVHIHITGVEKLPKEQKILFVGNHISNFDPIVTWSAFPKWNIAFVSKPENFKIPLFGRIIRKCCFLPIDRDNPRKALSTINSAAKLLHNREVSVGVYPEGTRGKYGELLPFHDGVFKIAKKAETPIAVIAVSGTDHIAKNFPWHKTDVYLDVLDVIPTENVQNSSTHLLGTVAACLLRKNIEKREKTWQPDTY